MYCGEGKHCHTVEPVNNPYAHTLRCQRCPQSKQTGASSLVKGYTFTQSHKAAYEVSTM